MVNDIKKLIDGDLLIKASTGQMLVGNGSNLARFVSLSGDILIASAGSVTIQAGKITTAMLSTSLITSAYIGPSAIAARALQYSIFSVSFDQGLSTSVTFSKAVASGTKVLGLYLISYSGAATASAFMANIVYGALNSGSLVVSQVGPAAANVAVIFNIVTLAP